MNQQTIDLILAFELGQLSKPEIMNLINYLADTGDLWALRGFSGKAACVSMQTHQSTKEN